MRTTALVVETAGEGKSRKLSGMDEDTALKAAGRKAQEFDSLSFRQNIGASA